MARPLELHTARRSEPTGREYVVTVFDEAGALICWCGPYDMRAWRDCIHLFVEAGWTEVREQHHYSRTPREGAASC